MAQDTTRRALLGGAGIAAALAAAPITAAATAAQSDPRLEALFADWQRCRNAIENSGDLADDDADQPYWDRIDAAEIAILNAPDATPRLATMRLWIALQHSILGKEATMAINNVDLAYFLARAETYDWNERHIINAIAALGGQPGAAYKGLEA